MYLSDGNSVCYEKVCIATGGAPKVCSLANVLFHDRFYTLMIHNLFV